MATADCTKEKFLTDVLYHKLYTLKDDGVYRHLKLGGGSFDCWYEIITWPGCLCIHGDMGTYTFIHIEDMFDFFRNKKMLVNKGYWAEKCVSESRFGNGIKEFSVDLFKKNVKADFRPHFRDSFYDRKTVKPAWKDIKEQLMHCETEWECVSALNDFDSEHYEFIDFWEYSNSEYTYHFVWCLYAIVYAIQMYDGLKKAKSHQKNPYIETEQTPK